VRGKCHYQEVNFSQSLQEELYQKKGLVQRLREELDERGQVSARLMYCSNSNVLYSSRDKKMKTLSSIMSRCASRTLTSEDSLKHERLKCMLFKGRLT